MNQLHGRAPKFLEARDIIERFRAASSEREKLKVLKSLKTKFPHIADRLHKLIS